MPLSIVLPTYNESQNIAKMLDSIAEALPADTAAEIIVVDDNSPDGTGDIAAQHAKNISNKKVRIEVIRRPGKMGLSSAILAGVQSAAGEIVVVMDGDFSHPPQTISHMLEELQDPKCDIVVASRYVKGGSVIGWPFKRRLMSKSATKIAQVGLGIEVKDPMSGFFAFRRRIIEGVKFDAIGYKMLLEILVKAKGARVKEVPYTFTNRRAGASKLDSSVMFDYLRAVWRLYRYGKSLREKERRASVRFLSKAARFYTIGATGLLVNYAATTLFVGLLPGIWILYAAVAGIVFSITSNFFLNKLWTFEDRDFTANTTLVQYGLFAGFSSPGAAIQLSMLYMLHGSQQVSYPVALVLAVMVAAVGNFLFNKKWTFKEKIWS
ncbi:dolichol-phosphate mannosyltransferase [Candidatus Nitrososphaera gargensis Ga9.2]|uniref:Dolichol-phosphate mannosyltransferase n=1 Tax=Nitrososphaera gargensis (strain Ga9.2) TaxID=1237085 RepID=K0IG33_NITGG|nr:dolichol-phosphate mannosyltransferase [Candidatus Nitrososphaera gargensis Ga9.2]